MSFSTENTILISIQNYRNIDSNLPIFYEIKNGVIFVLGLNNVGKSNLLKFFYDFRNIFSDHYCPKKKSEKSKLLNSTIAI